MPTMATPSTLTTPSSVSTMVQPSDSKTKSVRKPPSELLTTRGLERGCDVNQEVLPKTLCSFSVPVRLKAWTLCTKNGAAKKAFTSWRPSLPARLEASTKKPTSPLPTSKPSRSKAATLRQLAWKVYTSLCLPANPSIYTVSASNPTHRLRTTTTIKSKASKPRTRSGSRRSF